MMISKPFTKKEKLARMLSDGERHSRPEIMKELGCGLNVVHALLYLIRKELPENEMIICQLHGRSLWYRQVIRKVSKT